MPYMQSRGDYLGGGYQRGDPGLFGFLGGVAKRVAGHVLGGGIAGELVRATGATITTRFQERLPSPGQVAGPAGIQQVPSPRVSQQGTMKGGSVAVQNGAGCGPCQRGEHLNKSGYWTSTGFVAPGTKCVSNRTMNVGNSRALRRAIRREQGFVKLAQRSLKGTGYKIARR